MCHLRVADFPEAVFFGAIWTSALLNVGNCVYASGAEGADFIGLTFPLVALVAAPFVALAGLVRRFRRVPR
jgi:hypothetical protein